MTKRITRITVETRETLFMHDYGSLRQNYCPQCKKLVAILGMREIARTGIDIDAVCQKAEMKGLHFIETTNRMTFICLNSLFKGVTL